MNESQSTKLYLVFTATNGKTHTIIVDQPKDSLDKEEIQKVMNDLITYQLVEGNNGEIVGAKEAKYIERSVSTINLTE